MKIHNLKHIGHLDLAGGGQVSINDGIAYVGHMAPPIGTSIVDVSNPKAPRLLAQVEVPPTTHSHKARVVDHLLVVNHERYVKSAAPMRPGFRILDVSSPAHPSEIRFPSPIILSLTPPLKIARDDSAVINLRSRCMTLSLESPGSAADCGSWILRTLIGLGRWDILFRILPRVIVRPRVTTCSTTAAAYSTLSIAITAWTSWSVRSESIGNRQLGNSQQRRETHGQNILNSVSSVLISAIESKNSTEAKSKYEI